MFLKFLSQNYLFCCFLFLSSCSSSLYRRPPLPTAECYPRAECIQCGMDVRQLEWQDFFNDPTLQQLIVLALDNNRDLRGAIQRMVEAEALYGIQPEQQPPIGCSICSDNASCDCKCRLRNLKDCDLENYLATTEAQHDTYIKLIGQIANAYLMDTELNELICLTVKTIKIRQESARIVRLRYKEGASPKFDFLQAEAFLQQAHADLAVLKQKRELNWNAMTLLVGTPVCSDNNSLSQIESYFMKEICPGTPSELLCNRPDVLAAEHKLLAANANLTTIPLACNSSFLALPKARRDLALTEYEHTIQVAFREVTDALTEYAWLMEQIPLQKELLAALTDRARLAWIRFQCSTSPFFEVLDTERERFSAEQAYVQTRRALLTSGVNLYISLGGGYCR